MSQLRIPYLRIGLISTFCLLSAGIFLLCPAVTKAEDNIDSGFKSESGIKFNPQISIPGSATFQHSLSMEPNDWKLSITPKTMGEYISAVYTFAIGTVGILSTLILMFGGLLWATAAGNTGRVDNAKQWIFGAVTGLILALSSYSLLYIVNPQLIELKTLEITDPGQHDFTCCDPQMGPVNFDVNENSEGTLIYSCPNNVAKCSKDKYCRSVKSSNGNTEYACASQASVNVQECVGAPFGMPCLDNTGWCNGGLPQPLCVACFTKGKTCTPGEYFKCCSKSCKSNSCE